MQTPAYWLRLWIVLGALIAQASCVGRDFCPAIVRVFGPPDGVSDSEPVSGVHLRHVTYRKVHVQFVFECVTWLPNASPPYNWILVRTFDTQTGLEMSLDLAIERRKRQLHLTSRR